MIAASSPTPLMVLSWCSSICCVRCLMRPNSPSSESSVLDVLSKSMSGELVYEGREFGVQLGDATGVMGAEGYFNLVVDVFPVGVVVHLFGMQGYPDHKGEGGAKIIKHQ